MVIKKHKTRKTQKKRRQKSDSTREIAQAAIGAGLGIAALKMITR